MAEPTHGGEAAAGATGMPQLDFTTFPSQIFWLLVALVALYFILSKLALPRVVGAIEERHDAIEDDLDRAADFKRRAEKAEAALNKATADAKARAQEIAAAARAEVQAELDKAIAKADAEIAAKSAESEARIADIKASAMASVEAVATETAQALVDSFMPGAGDDGVRGAVQSRLQG
jgi:F-type H+-transporting ATPase subunit b